MKLTDRLIAALAAACMLLTGCSTGSISEESTLPAETSVTALTESTAAVTTETTLTTTETTTAPPQDTKPYPFQPKVCSVFMEEVFGEAMCEAWYHLVDAVMAGEDTFACPDEYTCGWVIGQFPTRCFPVLVGLIGEADDREHAVTDGIAHFKYLVPREEAAERIADFAEQVEGILNSVLEPGYSDFEKAAALYHYFAHTYQYDYDSFMKMEDTYLDYITPYRLFQTGIGICSEISPAYSYLLMEAGVDATVMMGDNHEWSYVRINGRNYHIDPTFVLSNEDSLSYFMMTDAQREETGCSMEEYVITSNYAQDHPHPDYIADDDTFAPLWDQTYDSLIPDQNTLHCWHYTEGWETEYFDFDYSGY